MQRTNQSIEQTKQRQNKLELRTNEKAQTQRKERIKVSNKQNKKQTRVRTNQTQRTNQSIEQAKKQTKQTRASNKRTEARPRRPERAGRARAASKQRRGTSRVPAAAERPRFRHLTPSSHGDANCLLNQSN